MSSDHAYIPLQDTYKALHTRLVSIGGRDVLIYYSVLSDTDGTAITNGVEDSANTTMVTLLANASFTGTWVDVKEYGVVSVSIVTDKASATDGLSIDWSANGSTKVQDDVFTITANIGKTFTFGPANRYFRVVYTNGGADQGSMCLQTVLRSVYVKPSSHRIQDSIIAEDDAELVKSVITALTPTLGFVNLTATDSGNLQVTDAENGLAIAKGDVAGTTFIHKFGHAPDFDIENGEVTIWGGSDDGGIDQTTYVYSSADDIDSLSSSDNGDTQDIEVHGLDTNYDEVIQTITLTGQTRVALTTDLIRVYRLVNMGSTDIAGAVYCFVNTALGGDGVPDDTTKIRAVINNGDNQTLMAVYTVPAGKTGYLRDWYASTAGKAKSVNVVSLKIRPFGQVFQVKHKASIQAGGSSYIHHKYEEPEIVSEKSDIEVLASTDINVASVSAGFDIVLIDN